MKKYLCKSLALSMTVLNLCNPISALSEDVHVANNRNNLKSYAIKGAKITGGVLTALLAGFGFFCVSRDLYSKFENSDSKKEQIEKFLSEYPDFDENTYVSVFKVFHSSDFTEEDLVKFYNCISKISSMYIDYSNPCIINYFNRYKYKNIFEYNSKEFEKFYFCTQFIYEKYFLPRKDDNRVCADRAIYILLNSDFYKYKRHDESTRNKLIYYDLISELLKSKTVNSGWGIYSTEDIDADGFYLERFHDKLLKTGDLSELTKLTKKFRSNVQVIEFQESDVELPRLRRYIIDFKNGKIDDALIQKCGDRFVLRVGSFRISVSDTIRLLEECLEHLKKNSFTTTVESSSSTAITTAAPSVVSSDVIHDACNTVLKDMYEARIERCSLKLEIEMLKDYIKDMIEKLKEIQS